MTLPTPVRRSLLVAALALALAPATALAQADAAGDQFRQGLKAVERGDFAAAAQSFEAAQRLVPHPVTAYNAALAWQSAGDRARAADDFALAIASGLTGAQEAEAQKRLATLDAELARVELTGPPGTTVKVRDENRPLPVILHVAPGEASFVGRLSDGRSIARRATLAAGAKASLDFTESKPTAPPLPPQPPPAPATSGGPPAWVGWTAVGAGVALVGASIGVGLSGMSTRDEFEAGNNTDANLREKAIAQRTLANVLWLGGALVGGTGVALLFWPRAKDENATTALRVGPGSVAFDARF